MNKTKIICTIGPASRDPEVLAKLMEAGMNVARLNFSHGTHAEHAALIHDIREISGRLGLPVAILQDLAGPKIRTAKLRDRDTITLVAGAPFTLTNRDEMGFRMLVGREALRGSILVDPGRSYIGPRPSRATRRRNLQEVE